MTELRLASVAGARMTRNPPSFAPAGDGHEHAVMEIFVCRAEMRVPVLQRGILPRRVREPDVSPLKVSLDDAGAISGTAVIWWDITIAFFSREVTIPVSVYAFTASDALRMQAEFGESLRANWKYLVP